ncbi:MAG: haloacid dehalogenase [Nocardioides sp.]|nr:haloacid dehalogenase [Nocardioides sp.]
MSVASGSAFAVIAVAQIANAFAPQRDAARLARRNPFVLGAVAVEALLLLGFLGIPWVSDLLGGSWPSLTGWLFCLLAVIVLPVVHAVHEALLRSRRR